MTIPTTGQAADATASTPSVAVSDFTLLIDLSFMPAAWWGDVDTADPTRGRASNAAGTTEYAVDWIDFDDTSETGWARVLVPGTHSSLSGVGVRLYAPNTRNASVSASDTYGTGNAYNSNWLGYWPLISDASDRTSYGNDGTANGGITIGGVSGVVGAATQFDGSNDYIGIESSTSLDSITSGFTLIAISDLTSPSGSLSAIFYKGAVGQIEIDYNSSGVPRTVAKTGTYDIATALSAGTGFEHLAGVFDQDATLKLYRDGAEIASTATSGAIDSHASEPASIGAWDNGSAVSRYVNAAMQGVQVHDVARSPSWINHEYDQCSDNATFW